MSLLQLQGLCKQFGDTKIIRDVSLTIEPGEKHAIIGPNGAGKSTLFHLITGRYSVSSGSILFKGAPIHNRPPYEIARLGLARSFQVTNIFPLLSVFENIRCALLWSMGYRYSFWHLLGKAGALNTRTEELLVEIGLQERRHLPAGELAYAEQRALELGIAIASGAEMIMLDEPVAGMSHSEARNAVELIHRVTAGKTLVMVEHDMSIVFDMADKISVLVYGEVIASDVPSKIRGNARVQEAYLGEVVQGESSHA
ncbi:MAG: ABC transporter ATP-binding protein [Gammaproteobacteria bacterium]